MAVCTECKKELKGQQKKFCSRKCWRKSVGRLKHGTSSAYNRGCRCKLCTAAWPEHMKEQRAKWRAARQKRTNPFHKRFVYAIQEEVTGAIKIGTSDDPEYRTQNLQTGNPKALTLLGYSEELNECEIQAELEPHCLRGEWFEPTEPVLAIVDRIVNGQ
jgi:hypothetical protein